MAIGRRDVMAGLGASLMLPRVAGAASDRLFAGTPLDGNRVAGSFHRVDLPLPDVAVLTRTGRAPLAALAGTPRLLTLWAEWCVPCLLEARDLAAARPRVAGDRFDIVSVLTGSSGRLDHAGAVARLEKAGATGLTVLVEPDGAHAIADALSIRPPAAALPPPPTLPPGARIVRNGGGYALPCTLLLDRHGRVRGRATGMASAGPPPAGVSQAPHPLTEAEKQALLGTRTAWSTPDGLALLQALHDGVLDRL